MVDINGIEIPCELITQLEKDWDEEATEDITYMKAEGKTFNDFIKGVNVWNYYNAEEIKEGIISDIAGDCDHYSECGYDCWCHLLSDANMDIDKVIYDEVLYNEFTEEDLENIWRKSK